MNTLQLLQLGGIWGLAFGSAFCVATLIIGRINAAMLLNDYPPDIRAKFGPMSAETRQQANKATLPLLATLGLILFLGLAQLRSIHGGLTFVSTLIFTTVIFQTWNLMDLLVLDWFLLMTLKPSFMILPGTEGMAGYRDYRFHVRKFLNGIVFTFILALIVTSIAVGVEWLL
jgi:hypothetical protein